MYVAPNKRQPGLKALRAQAIARAEAAKAAEVKAANAAALAKVAGK